MKKTTSLILTIIICFLSFSLSVFGHSGRTDSEGGHWNHSTGTYHWHHGKPAHQHEDRDGDGYKEWCPYENSGSSIQKETEGNKNNSSFATGETRPSSSKKSVTLGDVVGWGIAIFVFGCLALAIGGAMWSIWIEPAWKWAKSKFSKKDKNDN